MKKLFALFFALSLIFTLAACENNQSTNAPDIGSTAPSQPATQPTAVPTQPTQPTQPTPPTQPIQPHVHTPGDWAVDLEKHWQVCTDCGEALNESEHTLDDLDVCTDCQAEVYTSDYGTDIYLHDEQGNNIFALSYDLDGQLLVTYTWEYTYDDAGNMLTMKEYADGQLSYEAEYALGDDGFPYTAKDTAYYEDGSRSYSEYDQWYNNTVSIWYDAEGNVTYHIRHEYEMNSDGFVVYQKDYEDDVLVSETEYGIIEDEFGAYTYPAKEITYYEDGSKLITQYDENYEVISESYVDANGNPVDNSSKFNAEICAPLFGTWSGEMTLDEELMGMIGMEGMEGFSVKVSFSFTFTAEGKMITTMAIDPNSMLDFMVEFMYSMFEAEYDMTRDEADTYVQQQMGMSMHDYAALMLQSGDMADQFQQEVELVYYVEGNQIYAGNSWTSLMEPQEFTLEGDTLTLTVTSEDDAALSFDLVLTKEQNQEGLFDAEFCAPLFGTWSNDVIMPGELLGMTTDIRAHITMVFDDQGIRTTTILLNREDFAAAFKELYYNTYESFGLSRSEIDAMILAETGMTMDAFVEAYLETDEGKAVLTQNGSDFYYVEGNTLYCCENWTDEMSVIIFAIDGDALTVTVSDPEYTYTLIKIAD